MTDSWFPSSEVAFYSIYFIRQKRSGPLSHMIKYLQSDFPHKYWSWVTKDVFTLSCCCFRTLTCRTLTLHPQSWRDKCLRKTNLYTQCQVAHKRLLPLDNVHTVPFGTSCSYKTSFTFYLWSAIIRKVVEYNVTHCMWWTRLVKDLYRKKKTLITTVVFSTIFIQKLQSH